MTVTLPEPLAAPVVDSHCHLDIKDFERTDHDDLDVSEPLVHAASVNVTKIVQIGVDVASSRWSAAVADRNADVIAAVGLHPNEAPRIMTDSGRRALDEAFVSIEQAARSTPRVRAIGETGLDYFRTGDDGRAAQHESFRWHIDLTKRLGKTLVIHDRDAHEDVVRILLEEGPPDRVIFHCFSGGVDLAEMCSEHGWFMSFAGVVTFKNADGLRDALRIAPLELLLVETDAPFLTPEPNRGKPNASVLMPWTVRTMAKERDLTEVEMATALYANTMRAFGDW